MASDLDLHCLQGPFSLLADTRNGFNKYIFSLPQDAMDRLQHEIHVDNLYMLMLVGVHRKAAVSCAFQPRHDKTNKMSVRPAKTQISLDIRPV